MYVGNGQPRFREGKGLFFKSRRFVGYLHKYKRATPTIIGKLHVTHPSNELTPLSIVFDCGNRCPLGGSARISRFDLGIVVQDHIQQGIMDLEFPLYSIKPNLRNLFMKKLTRDRVVPIISASVS
jgi:hypothetical protein